MSLEERMRLRRLSAVLHRESSLLEDEGDVDGAFRCIEAARGVEDRVAATIASEVLEAVGA